VHNLKAESFGVVPNLGFRVSHDSDLLTNELSVVKIEVELEMDGHVYMEDDELLRSLVISDVFVLEGGPHETFLHFDVSIVVFLYFCLAARNEYKLTTPVLVTVKEGMVAGDELVLGNEEGC
jgi:hypothetical protein